MADPTIDNISAKRAAFSANFLGTTNLAQRRRYQEDIEAARKEEGAAFDRQFERANQLAEIEDPLKARTIRNQEAQFEHRMSAEEKRFQIRMQKDQEVMSLRQRQAEIAEARELRLAKDARRVVENTDAVETAEFSLRERGILPGSKEYAQAMVQQVIRNPYIDPSFRKTILDQANVQDDPDEVMLRVQKGMKNPQVTVFVSPEGKERYTIREGPDPKAPKPIDTSSQLTEYKKLVDAFNKEGDPAFKAELEKKVHSMRKTMESSSGSTSASGSPKPLDKETAGAILKEAGGDPTKARSLAKERGYTF